MLTAGYGHKVQPVRPVSMETIHTRNTLYLGDVHSAGWFESVVGYRIGLVLQQLGELFLHQNFTGEATYEIHPVIDSKPTSVKVLEGLK